MIMTAKLSQPFSALIFDYALKYLRFLLKPYTPLFANLDITMKCNSKCSYCLRWTDNYSLGSFSKKQSKQMTTEQAYSVIDNIAQFPVLLLTIQGAEPLTRADIPQILKYAKNKGLQTMLITNGILLEKRAEQIAPYLDNILISYDTPYAADYKLLRGVNALKTVERGIKKIVKLSKIYKFVVVTNSVLTKINAPYIDKLISHVFNKLGVHGMSFEELLVPNDKRCNWSYLKIPQNLFNSVVQTIKKFKKTYPIMNSNFYLDHLRKHVNYICKPWLFLMINADGTCNLPCVAYPKKVIDFKKPNAKDAWYSNKKIWDFKCNLCTMQCIIETSKMFPFPPFDMFIDWLNNVRRARAAMLTQ